MMQLKRNWVGKEKMKSENLMWKAEKTSKWAGLSPGGWAQKKMSNFGEVDLIKVMTSTYLFEEFTENLKL